MTVTNYQNGKPLKHYAQNADTKERYIVIALQNETDPNYCSVVTYDALDSNLRAELLAAVNSDEFQSVPEIWKLLDKKYFFDYPQQTMLNVLKSLRQIKNVEQNLVKVELPGDVTMTPKEIINAMKTYEEEKNKNRFNYREIDVKASQAVAENNNKINDLESRLGKLENDISTINSNISDLISVVKQQVALNSNKE